MIRKPRNSFPAPLNLFEFELAVEALVRSLDQQKKKRQQTGEWRTDHRYENRPQRHGTLHYTRGTAARAKHRWHNAAASGGLRRRAVALRGSIRCPAASAGRGRRNRRNIA